MVAPGGPSQRRFVFRIRSTTTSRETSMQTTRVSPIALWFALLLSPVAMLHAADTSDADKKDHDTKEQEKKEDAKPAEHFVPERVDTAGSVTSHGTRIDYEAHAGTLVVHTKDWDDVPQNAPKDEDKKPRAEASMFYVAYFKSDKSVEKGNNVKRTPRPITFLFNGGPGSSTVWLHMGAFGPKRVVTANDSHTPAAPYSLIDNEFSLLDASDLVFIDAPGAGFSRIAGTEHDKAFYGVDEDAWAFSDFIVQFLGTYGRWNSAKYLFGESYGTTRSAVLVNLLQTERQVDFNGIILLSQILNFDGSPDGPDTNPGVDLPYELALPTYAATAWYHHKLTDTSTDLPSLLNEVEHFAMNDYALALQAGWRLPDDRRREIAQKLHQYTALSTDYILKANLRIDGGEFEHNLLGDTDTTTGRLDTRFTGPTLDPLSKEADYDPQSAAIGSAYVSTFNDYVRKQLKYGQDRIFKPFADIKHWNFGHQPPGQREALQQSTNVMPDLANAMKINPDLHVLLTAGYFDLATPYYQGIYEMQHLPIPSSVQKHIEFAQFQSGHMVYANENSLKELHTKVADFIHRTEGGGS
jgi:carboxypeptidase C (cathepsin A)